MRSARSSEPRPAVGAHSSLRDANPGVLCEPLLHLRRCKTRREKAPEVVYVAPAARAVTAAPHPIDHHDQHKVDEDARLASIVIELSLLYIFALIRKV